MMNWQDLVDRI